MRRALILTAVGAVVVVALYDHGTVQHWLAVHLGILKAGPDPFYNFWSGFGSDLGEITLVTGVVLAWRHHNCHVRGCPRLGKPVDGTPYVACPRHHPAHEGSKRGVSLEAIHEAFHRRRR